MCFFFFCQDPETELLSPNQNKTCRQGSQDPQLPDLTKFHLHKFFIFGDAINCSLSYIMENNSNIQNSTKECSRADSFVFHKRIHVTCGRVVTHSRTHKNHTPSGRRPTSGCSPSQPLILGQGCECRCQEGCFPKPGSRLQCLIQLLAL